MHDVRVALAQISPELGNLQANLGIHRAALAGAKRERAQVVMFPELSLTGYLLRDDVPAIALRADAPELRALSKAAGTMDVVVGFVEEADGLTYHNSAAYLSGGRVVHVHRKVYLPTYGMFDEGRDFAAGERIRAFPSRFGPAGMLICEDVWHPTSSWILAQQGAEILYAPSSGPTRGAKPGKGVTSVAVWHDLLRVTAEFQTSFVVYVNRVGYEDGLNFGGGSAAVDPFGRVIASLPPLEEGLAVADLRAEVLRRARIAYPLLRDDNLELVHRELDRIRTLRYDLPEGKTGPQAPEATRRARPK